MFEIRASNIEPDGEWEDMEADGTFLAASRAAAEADRGSTAAGITRVLTIAPLLPPAVGFVVGVIVDRAAGLPAAFYVAALAIATVFAAVRAARSRGGWAILLVAGFAIGGVLHHGGGVSSPGRSIARFATQRGLIVRVRGEVASAPMVTRADPGPLSIAAFRAERTRFLLDVKSVGGAGRAVPVEGLVRVTVREPVLDLAPGEEIEIHGRLYALQPPSNPGAFDWAAFMRRSGVVATLTCGYRESVERLGLGHGAVRAGLLSRLRGRLRGWLVDDLVVAGDDEANLLSAMVLGHRSAVDQRINDVFLRAGCAHFLAASGVHIVLVLLIASVACRLLCLPRGQRVWVLIIVVACYAMIAEPRPSILRASVMAEIYLIACLLHRERARLNWVCATVLILGIVDAGMIFDVGYQLSTSAVVGILFLPRVIRNAIGRVRRLRSIAGPDQRDEDAALRRRLIVAGRSAWSRRFHEAWRRLGRYAGEGLVISLAAWLATWPIVALHFGQLHPFGPLATVVMMPMLAVLMAAGFVKLMVAAVVPWFVGPLVVLVNVLDSACIVSADALGSLPGASLACSRPPWLFLGVYYACLALWCLHASRTDRSTSLPAPSHEVPPCGTNLRRVAWVATAAVAASFAWWALPRMPPGRLTMTVLDVGAGSATVLELPDGKVMLFDAGTLGTVDVGRHVVLPFLRYREIDHIDRAYVSHANLDHYNGLPSIVSSVPCDELYVNDRFIDAQHPDGLPAAMLDMVAGAGCDVRVLDGGTRRWRFGGADFEVLWPPDDPSIPMKDNDASTVLRVAYAGRSILLTGDIEDVGQQGLLANAAVAADVLVLPHHGSVRSSSGVFFESVQPAIMVRSSNERMSETVNGLPLLVGAARLLNTADVGAVTVVLDGRGVSASGYRSTGGPGPE